MSNFFIELVRVLLALGIVIVLILLISAFLPKLLEKFRIRYVDNEDFRIKKLLPLSKGINLLVLEIKGKLHVMIVTERYTFLVYKDDVDSST
ncbi:hypothetical protein [Thermocrinis minervae]|uniref:Uncharacterized protein n=1 Tax=Thermocrinis minervae TaxID=381751 RepID=A0A1M6PZQ6_9AQUI|nr:hypothetical protein [Thermocrinis minervae]SHK13429.1 hypothetical protein SAMN05444391_0018 [Thermocrinis minervae]